MNTLKTRHQFYLPDDLSDTLDSLAAKPGASKTTILTDALRAWLDRRAGNELDDRFGERLNLLQKIDERIETSLEMLTELFDTFILHEMTMTAHQPPFDDAARNLGRKRYDDLINLVARRIRKRRHHGLKSSIAAEVETTDA
jgi:hypothetical protein